MTILLHAAQSSDETSLKPRESTPSEGIRPRGLLREFAVFCCDQETDRYREIGLTLDEVLRREEEFFAGEVDGTSWDGASPSEIAASWNDVVVWEGKRVAAVLRPRPGGSGLEITRFEEDVALRGELSGTGHPQEDSVPTEEDIAALEAKAEALLAKIAANDAYVHMINMAERQLKEAELACSQTKAGSEQRRQARQAVDQAVSDLRAIFTERCRGIGSFGAR